MARIMARPRVAPVVERVAPVLPAEPEEIAQPTLLAPEPERETAQALSTCPASGTDVHPALQALAELREVQASIPRRRAELVATLAADGIGYAEVARVFGVTRQTVREWAGAKSR